jgi:uncharacterized membrane protein
MVEREQPKDKSSWLDQPGNTNKIWYGIIALCVVTALSDLLYHKHVKYDVEDLVPGMYGWYGLASCAVLVLGAKILQIIVRRREDYYDEAGDD